MAHTRERSGFGRVCWQISLDGPARKGQQGELSLDETRMMI